MRKDLFDQLVEWRVGVRRGLHERVEVHDDQVDQGDAVLPGGGEVARLGAARQDAAVHLGVQGLHPAVHHLGEAGHLGDADDGQPGVLQGAGGAAGGDEVEAARGQCAREVDDTSFV